MKVIEILSYTKIADDDVHGETARWSVEIIVDEMFHINFPIPTEVKPTEFQTYLDDNYEVVLKACKQIYQPILSMPSAQVERHIKLEAVKKAVDKLSSKNP